MKQMITLMMTLLLLVSFACAEPLRIGVMSGPTGMGMAQLMSTQPEDYTFEIYAAPTDATADLASGTLDLLCLPTNTAASLSNAKADYITVMAVNCLGTLYLVTDAQTRIASLSDLEGMTIWAGVPTSTTGAILQELFRVGGVSAQVEWEADHDAVVARLLRGEIHAAVLPEPKVTVALSKAEGWQVALNLSALWDATHTTRLPMGCIVARNDTLRAREADVASFMKDYSASIAFIADAAHRAEAADMIAAAGILPAAGVAKKALANLDGSIVYEDGEQMKADLQAFYEIIGLKQPADAFYAQ